VIVDLFIPVCRQLYPRRRWTWSNCWSAWDRCDYNHEQTCCRQPAFNSGYFDSCKEVGEKFIKNSRAIVYIVSPSASCTDLCGIITARCFITPLCTTRIDRCRKNLFDSPISSWNILKITDLGAKRMVLQPSMILRGLREYGIHREPRVLLSKVRDSNCARWRIQKCAAVSADVLHEIWRRGCWNGEQKLKWQKKLAQK